MNARSSIDDRHCGIGWAGYAPAAALVLSVGLTIPQSVAGGVVVLANRTLEKIEFRLVVDRAAPVTCQMSPAAVRPYWCRQQVVVQLTAGQQSYDLAPNAIYVFHGEGGAIGLTRVALETEDQAAGEAGRTDRPDTAGAAPTGTDTGTATVTVKILVDDEEPTLPAYWQPLVRRLVALASEPMQRYSGIGFEVVAVGTWQSDDEVTDWDEALLDFQRKVDPAPARLAIGLSRQHSMTASDFARRDGIRTPLGTHILIPHAPGRTSRSLQVDMLTHQLGHYLGATHSPDLDSVMRRDLDRILRGGGSGANATFDPINTLIISLVGEQLRGNGLQQIVDLQPNTRRLLLQAYSVIAESLPDDPVARVDSQVRLLLQPSPAADYHPRLLLSLPLDAGLVMDAVRRSAAANPPRMRGDELTERYVRAAAAAVNRLPWDRATAALAIGLGVALDRSGTLQSDPFSRFACRAVRSRPDDQAPAVALGTATVHGRPEAADALFATLALARLGGPDLAYREGLRHELRDARRGHGFCFADLAARMTALALDKQLRQSPAAIRELATTFRVADYVPATPDLAPTVGWREFLAVYGDVTSQAFAEQRQSIQSHIDRLAAGRRRPHPPGDGDREMESAAGRPPKQPADGSQAKAAGSPLAPPPAKTSAEQGPEPNTLPPVDQDHTTVLVSNIGALRRAIRHARPGAQIRVAPGDYSSDLYLGRLTGSPNLPITIEAADPWNPPRFTTGSIRLRGCAYVTLRGLLLTGRSTPAIDIADGERPNHPTHHMTLDSLQFHSGGSARETAAAVRMAGVEDFTIRGCQFQRWGHRAVDLIGCHLGQIRQCLFSNAPDADGYALQVAGGSSQIVIRRCTFSRFGRRAVSIGGETNMASIRPRGAKCEARDITVEGCTFVRGGVPVAYAGADRAAVRFNTIVHPGRWVLRVLQENTDATLVRCRYGVFENNLVVYRDEQVSGVVDVGANTQPETFLFANNLWYCEDAPGHRPRLPTMERGGTYDVDPKLEGDRHLVFLPGSPEARSFGATGLTVYRQVQPPYTLQPPDVSRVSTDSWSFVRSRMNRTVIAIAVIVVLAIGLLFLPWKTVAVLSWAYLAGLMAVWMTLRLGSDRWWLATVMLYGPRFVYGIPLPMLAVAAALRCRRHLWVLAAAAIVLLFPIFGFCVSWPWSTAGGPPSLRVVTLNACGNAVAPERIIEMIDQLQPDVVALEEWASYEPIPWPEGWRSRRDGKRLLASRLPIDTAPSPGEPNAARPAKPRNATRVVIEIAERKLDVFVVHLPTPRRGLERLYRRSNRFRFNAAGIAAVRQGIARRRRQSMEVRRWIDSFHGPAIILGDFNMPVDSTIYREVWSDWRNAFSTAGFGFGYTKQTPLLALDGMIFGARIDHILVRARDSVRRCWIGPDLGSDHRPICADLSAIPLHEALSQRTP